MSVVGTPRDLTVKQLQARVNLHTSTAAMFQKKGYPKTAAMFLELAKSYQDELDGRASAEEFKRLHPNVVGIDAAKR
jgi:hypothetical protein